MSDNKVTGAHLIGSIPLDSAEETFRVACKYLSGDLKRLPDGETGLRWRFVYWQYGQVEKVEPRAYGVGYLKPPQPLHHDEEAEVLAKLHDIELQYEDYALSSYKIFTKLRDEGVIPQGVRFQVGLPSPVNMLCLLIKPVLRKRAEPIYEKAMLESLRRIQDVIPAHDLAIQWDCVCEIMMLEGERTFFEMDPWFEPTFEGIVDRLSFLVDAVAEGVEVGLHLCYGDDGKKHVIEPRDLGTLTKLSNAVLAQVHRPINWIHMPVPIDRKDRAYFEPLGELKADLQKTDLVLGLVHYDDLEGTRQRIKMGGEFVDRFRVATECGMGRTPREQVADILTTAATVCESR